jgi:hypothetical protein
MRSIQSRESVAAFEGIRARAAELSAFAEPAAVVTYLAQPGGDSEAKDRVIRQLVLALKAGQPPVVVTSILLLGLWPGLDAAFNRRARLFRQQPDLGGELLQRFIAEARAMDLMRVNRIAATLVRNTERRVLQAHLRQIAVVTVPQALSAGVADPSSVAGWVSPVSFPMPTGRSDVESVAVLRSWLRGVLGRDGDLVADAVLLGRTRSELADDLGLSTVAVRKRLQRALARARREMETKNCRSRSAAKPAFGPR